MRQPFIIGQAVAVLALVWLSATAMEKNAIFLLGGGACSVIVGLTFASLSWSAVKQRSLWPPFTTASLALVGAVSVVTTAWPLRLNFALTRPAFQRLAESVRAGQQIDAPVRIGLFVIKKTEVSRQEAVCLWTELDPSGNTGFVQCGGNRVPLNLWSRIQLDEQWSLVAED